MQINDLYTYMKIYELKSINQAAKQLGYSQSNITVRLKSLENELQTKLFQRSYRGLKPTKAGNLTYNYAQNVIALTKDLKSTLKQQVNNQNILISELLFKYLVIEKKHYKLSDYNFEIKKSTDIVNSKDNTEQMVITYADFQAPDYNLIEKNWLPIAFLSNDGSAKKPFLINSDVNCPIRKRTLNQVGPDHVVEIDSWDNIISLVKQGQGSALLPQYLTNKDSHLQIIDQSKTIKLPYYIYVLSR